MSDFENPYNLQVKSVRKRGHNPNDQDWSNSDLKDLITEWTAKFHQAIGRSLSSPYSKTTHPKEYHSARGTIKAGVASEILLSQDDFVEDGREARLQYQNGIKGFKSSKLIFYGAGPNVTDQLDPVNYVPEASPT